MAGLWDSLMKRLVRRYARHFAGWLVAEAVFVRALDIELQKWFWGLFNYVFQS